MHRLHVCGSLILVALLSAAFGMQTDRVVERADLVLRSGRIATVSDARPEVEALAVRGDLVVAIGSDAEIAPYVGDATKVIDLAGRRAVPGFIEGHGHFTGIGTARRSLDAMSVRNWDEIVAKVAEAARKAKPGEWITGRGWHQEKWDRKPEPSVEGFPTHDALSKASPDNPVYLTHASGHAGFANRKAMELAGVARATANPAGGEILKDARGEPIGVFRETAQGLIRGAIAKSRAAMSQADLEREAREEIRLAAEECLSKGITSFQDAGSSFRTIDLFKKLADEGKLPLRLWVMIREGNAALGSRLARYRLIDYGGRRLTVRAIKRSIDGALGSRGAWLLAPYADLPSSTGLNTTPVAEIAETARMAIDNEFQLCVHAIGDRANRETLDLVENLFRSRPQARDLRWRIEHAQHLAAVDIPRFGKLGVVASMQGIHCTSDAPYVTARLGPARAEEGAYVWQKLMRSGAVVTNGTDAPVEDVSPIASYYATVSRRLRDGSVFYGDQKMSRAEALRSYTLDAAWAAFEEKAKGSLEPGKLADITVLSRDILTVPEDQIPGAEVAYTIVGGKIAYSK